MKKLLLLIAILGMSALYAMDSSSAGTSLQKQPTAQFIAPIITIKAAPKNVEAVAPSSNIQIPIINIIAIKSKQKATNQAKKKPTKKKKQMNYLTVDYSSKRSQKKPKQQTKKNCLTVNYNTMESLITLRSYLVMSTNMKNPNFIADLYNKVLVTVVPSSSDDD